MARRVARPALVFDANVLIDYWEGNRALLQLISSHLASIIIPSAVFDEVDQFTDRHCRSLGIVVVEPSIEQWTMASQESAGLSLADHLCLMIAKERHSLCVTNDIPLRQRCLANDVQVWWGLEPLVALVQQGYTTPKIARRAGIKMREKNPHYITHAIIEEFLVKIGFEPK